MGLDNGIGIQSEDKITFLTINPISYNKIPPYDYELLYWRKWWGFRNEVMDYLGTNDYKIFLTISQLKDIKKIYNSFNDEKKWINDGDSIWSWEDVKNQFEDGNKYFDMLISYKELHPTAEIYFYDSY